MIVVFDGNLPRFGCYHCNELFAFLGSALSFRVSSINSQFQVLLFLAEAGYRPPMDSALQGYVDDITRYIQPLTTLKEQVVALAQ